MLRILDRGSSLLQRVPCGQRYLRSIVVSLSLHRLLLRRFVRDDRGLQARFELDQPRDRIDQRFDDAGMRPESPAACQPLSRSAPLGTPRTERREPRSEPLPPPTQFGPAFQQTAGLLRIYRPLRHLFHDALPLVPCRPRLNRLIQFLQRRLHRLRLFEEPRVLLFDLGQFAAAAKPGDTLRFGFRFRLRGFVELLPIGRCPTGIVKTRPTLAIGAKLFEQRKQRDAVERNAERVEQLRRLGLVESREILELGQVEAEDRTKERFVDARHLPRRGRGKLLSHVPPHATLRPPLPLAVPTSNHLQRLLAVA